MTTNYTMADGLPKDVAGAKFSAWIDDTTSQNDFVLPKGIGGSSFNTKRLGHLAIGTQTQGSPVAAGHPGVLIMGYNGTLPSVSDGQAQFFKISASGALLTSQAPGERSTSKNATSVSTGALSFNSSQASTNKLVSVTVRWSSAPTTNENLQVEYQPVEGGSYNTLLVNFDPAPTSATTLVFIPDEEFLLSPSDIVNVSYTNTDSLAVGGIVITETV